MKKSFFCLLALLLVSSAGCMHVSNLTDSMLDWVGSRSTYEETGDPGLVKRTVITPFRYGKPELAPQAKYLQAAVETALQSRPDIKLLTFRELQKASIEFGSSELVAEDRYLTGARHMGLNLIIVGEVSGMYVDYNLQGVYGFRDSLPQLIVEGQVRMVDGVLGTVHSVRSFRSALILDDVQAQSILTGSSPDKEMVHELLAGIIEENLPLMGEDIETFAWSGMVLEVDGKLALINGGQDTGLNPGDTLVLYQKTERLVTGGGHSIYPLGRPVGKLVLVEVMAETAWGEVQFDLPEVNEDADEDDGAYQPNAPIYDVQVGQLVRTH